MVFFRMVFMVPSSGSGFSTEMPDPGQLVPVILSNLKTYIATINDDFGLVWKALIALSCVLFIVRQCGSSIRKKPAALIVSLVFIALAFFLSYGVYCMLENPSFQPRALIGFGVFTAATGICVAGARNRAATTGVLLLNWCFLVFAFSYGNALADQKRYTDFQVETLLHDQSGLFPGKDMSKIPVYMDNGIGFGPVTENVSEHYPVIKRLVPSSRHYHLYIYLSEYFHWGRGYSDNEAPPDMPVVLDSYYHTVRSNGEHIRVTFNN
jgi:hypothetical protein